MRKIAIFFTSGVREAVKGAAAAVRARCRALRCMAAITVLIGSASSASAQTWQALGPEGGTVTLLLADPGVAARVYALGEGGLFRSDDAGEHWMPAGAGLPTGFPEQTDHLMADPDQPGRMYASDVDGALFRSNDAGMHWLPTGYVAPRINEFDAVSSLTDIPGRSNAILLTMQGSSLLYESVDGGVTFTTHSLGLPDDATLGSVAVDPTNPAHYLVGFYSIGFTLPGTAPSLYRSDDAGQSWSGVTLPVGLAGSRKLQFLSGNRLVAVVGNSLLLSLNHGTSWQVMAATEGGNIVELPGEPAGLLMANRAHCRVSHDNFATSTACDDGLPFALPANAEAPIFNTAVTPLPQGGYRLLVSGHRFGVYASVNAALPWTSSNSSLHAIRTRALAIHPRDSARLYVGAVSSWLDHQEPLWSTTNHGATWQASLYMQARAIRSIRIDPTVADTPGTTTLYAGGEILRFSNNTVSPGPLYKSLDGSGAWNPITGDLPVSAGVNVGAVRKIALAPRSCSTPLPSGACQTGPLNTLYAIADGSSPSLTEFRVMKSTSGGAHWTDASDGLPLTIQYDDAFERIRPRSLALDPIDPLTLYVGTFGEYEDIEGNPLVPTIPNGVFRSADGGASWTQRSSGLPLVPGSSVTAHNIVALVAHPRRSGVLWASAQLGTGDSQIYTTLNGGQSWSAAGAALTQCIVNELAVDSAAPQILYAVGTAQQGTEGCVYRSEDSGATWLALHADLHASVVYSVARDPSDQTRIVVGTNTGVWELHSPPDRIFSDRD
ncbi:MAG: hypothetical protein ABI411_14200 [Tahibacter sp.]